MEVCAEEQSLERGRLSMFFGRVEDSYRQEPGDREERIQQSDAHGKAQCECAAALSKPDGFDDEKYDERPYEDERDGVIPLFRLSVRPHIPGFLPAFRPHVAGDELYCQRDQSRNQDEIVQRSQNRDEIGDEVDRRQHIAHCHGCQHLCQYGSPAVFQREKHGGNIVFQFLGAFFQLHMYVHSPGQSGASGIL